MARYIDAEKINYHEISVCGGHGLNCEYTAALKHEIDAIPAADVVSRAELSIISVQNAALVQSNRNLKLYIAFLRSTLQEILKKENENGQSNTKK
jgi:hypothetical protein